MSRELNRHITEEDELTEKKHMKRYSTLNIYSKFCENVN